MEHYCDRCEEAPARFIREDHAVCETCAAHMDARARVNATWCDTTRRSRRTNYADVLRVWQAR